MPKRTKIVLVVAVVALAAASRLVKHPFNFTPIAAMGIFAGCYFGKKWGFLIPLAAMAVSDYFIGFYDWQIMASVYFGIAAAYGIGWLLKKRRKWYDIAAASIASSILFFIITNFSVWAFFNWYPHTIDGLVSCFTLAVPFFRNTLIGDVVYTGALFGAFEFAVQFMERKSAVKLNYRQTS
jgi:hypothetical protein